MYSASTSPGGGGGQGGEGGGEVTLRLREAEDIPEEVLARLGESATLSISLQGDAVLRLGAAGAGKTLLLIFNFFLVYTNEVWQVFDRTNSTRIFKGVSRRSPGLMDICWAFVLIYYIECIIHVIVVIIEYVGVKVMQVISGRKYEIYYTLIF